MYLNKVTIIGNLTRDPEIKSIPSGQKVCSFSVATNETYKDAQGQKKEKVEFHNIVVWGKTAENVAQYMKKGSQILVEGKLQTRSWDGQDGKKLYRTEIMAQTVQFGSKPKVSNDGHHQGNGSDVTQSNEAPDVTPGGYDGEVEDINLDDIPF